MTNRLIPSSCGVYIVVTGDGGRVITDAALSNLETRAVTFLFSKTLPPQTLTVRVWRISGPGDLNREADIVARPKAFVPFNYIQVCSDAGAMVVEDGSGEEWKGEKDRQVRSTTIDVDPPDWAVWRPTCSITQAPPQESDPDTTTYDQEATTRTPDRGTITWLICTVIAAVFIAWLVSFAGG